jgi:hypothetical protein
MTRTVATKITHRDGRWWHDQPRPKVLHRCTWATRGIISPLTTVDRCACGGIRMTGDRVWHDRNRRWHDTRHQLGWDAAGIKAYRFPLAVMGAGAVLAVANIIGAVIWW